MNEFTWQNAGDPSIIVPRYGVHDLRNRTDLSIGTRGSNADVVWYSYGNNVAYKPAHSAAGIVGSSYSYSAYVLDFLKWTAGFGATLELVLETDGTQQYAGVGGESQLPEPNPAVQALTGAVSMRLIRAYGTSIASYLYASSAPIAAAAETITSGATVRVVIPNDGGNGYARVYELPSSNEADWWDTSNEKTKILRSQKGMVPRIVAPQITSSAALVAVRISKYGVIA